MTALIDRAAALALLDDHGAAELVLTGRGLLPLADLADLVTEMRPVKHYFDEGLLARQGIEY